MKLVLVVLMIGGAAHADPTIPQEVTDLLKITSGTWKCTGTMKLQNDGEPVPTTGILKVRGDLDGYFVHDSFEAKVGKAKLKSEAFTTFDSRKWRRVVLDNRGLQVIGTCDGLKDGKMDFNLDVVGGSGPATQMRDHLDVTDPKALKVAGEMSIDKGKTWTKVYELTCKK